MMTFEDRVKQASPALPRLLREWEVRGSRHGYVQIRSAQRVLTSRWDRCGGDDIVFGPATMGERFAVPSLRCHIGDRTRSGNLLDQLEWLEIHRVLFERLLDERTARDLLAIIDGSSEVFVQFMNKFWWHGS